jgi:plasmid stabilization system protein ParE
MIYRVVITDAARFDLLAIGRSIRPHNPPRSETFVDELHHRCLALGDFPKSYALIDDPKSRGVRRAIHHNYLIFFHIVNTTVEVLHVLHGGRDYQALLFPDDER